MDAGRWRHEGVRPLVRPPSRAGRDSTGALRKTSSPPGTACFPVETASAISCWARVCVEERKNVKRGKAGAGTYETQDTRMLSRASACPHLNLVSAPMLAGTAGRHGVQAGGKQRGYARPSAAPRSDARSQSGRRRSSASRCTGARRARRARSGARTVRPSPRVASTAGREVRPRTAARGRWGRSLRCPRCRAGRRCRQGRRASPPRRQAPRNARSGSKPSMR